MDSTHRPEHSWPVFRLDFNDSSRKKILTYEKDSCFDFFDGFLNIHIL